MDKKDNLIYSALGIDSCIFSNNTSVDTSGTLAGIVFEGAYVSVARGDDISGIDIFNKFLRDVHVISLNDCTVLQSDDTTAYLFPNFTVDWQATLNVEDDESSYRSVSVRDMTAIEFALEQKGVDHVRVEKHEEGLIDVSSLADGGENVGKAGVKDDGGKVKASLMRDFSAALSAVATVGTFGADKYTRGGWQSVEGGIERYADAGQRHLDAWCMEGESDHDLESGLSHLAHYAWNVLAELELRIRADRMGYND